VGDSLRVISRFGVREAWAGSVRTVWSTRLFVAALSGTAVLTGILTARSLSWPMAHDAPLMHYLAWLIRHGVVPYREIFDMNLPGTYLLHLLALGLFGPSDFGLRLFDLSVLALTSIGMIVAARSFGRWASLSAALIFWLYHVAGGAWQTGQRDFLLTLFLAWGTALVILAISGGKNRLLVGAGLCLGFAVWIKPHGIVFLLATMLLLFVRRGDGALRSLGLLLGGTFLSTAGILGWLAGAGGLGAFFELVSGYLLPLYSPLGRGAMGEMLRWHSYGGVLWATLALLIGLSVYQVLRDGAFDHRHALLAFGLLYGLVHFFGQGKGWEYHLTPLALFASLLGASALDRIFLQGSQSVQTAAVGLFVLLSAVLGMKGAEAFDAPWYVAKRQRAIEVAETLKSHLRPGDTVQVMDTTDGGIHALFLLGVRQPTRFLYDFHFYHDVEHPTIQSLRREFVEGLRGRPPAFIVLFEETWLHPGYDRVRAWPALRDVIAGAYILDREGAGYRIYAKRTDS